MKRKTILSAMLLVLVSIIALQSCKKEAPVAFKQHFAFTEPTPVAPLNDSTIKISGTTVDLTWASSTPDGTAPLADVYFGTDPNPGLYQANVAALTLNVPVEQGLTYYWYIIMKDAQGVRTYSPIWNFTVFEPIGIFVGAYDVNEPAEAWHYTVHFTKASPTTLNIDLYWASWPAVFTLDFTANTYSMPLTNFGGGYWGIESGTIDPTTGTMTGTYTIYNPTVTTVAETGPHTYTKK